MQCQPVGEAGTPWAEIVAGSHSRARASQTVSSEAQTLQPMDDLTLSLNVYPKKVIKT